MAHYTLTLQQILQGGINLFDFEYPMFKEEFKPTFEKLFIDYFYLEEIAHETVGQFKHRLKTRLNVIMPYYNKLYESQELEQRILDNYDVTEEIKRVISGDMSKEFNGTSTSNTSNTSTSSGTNTQTEEKHFNDLNKKWYKDAPKTRIDINNFDVVTNLTKEENNNDLNGSTQITGNTSTTNDVTENLQNINTETSRSGNTENYTRTMKGNIGVQTDADAIIKYWQSLRNVTLEIFECELSNLFMGVY